VRPEKALGAGGIILPLSILGQPLDVAERCMHETEYKYRKAHAVLSEPDTVRHPWTLRLLKKRHGEDGPGEL
jgi:hypothetical protein